MELSRTYDARDSGTSLFPSPWSEYVTSQNTYSQDGCFEGIRPSGTSFTPWLFSRVVHCCGICPSGHSAFVTASSASFANGRTCVIIRYGSSARPMRSSRPRLRRSQAFWVLRPPTLRGAPVTT